MRNGPRTASRRCARVLTTTVLLVGSGCASTRIHSEVAPQAQLAQYRTYAWESPSGTPERPQTILDQDVRTALGTQLPKRGFVEASSGAPDFLVGFHVLREHKMAVTDWGSGLYGWAPEVTSYTEGTLIVDFIDPKTYSVFWRGSATGAVEHPGIVNVKRINKAIMDILDRYPSQVANRP
jgi:hypothetical protein